ncbi:MAG: NAD(P)-dependent oxidoreductase [Exiguobacterium profundum]|nr:MAG: NAD(P)-dependent oxidoreductase [Exiguobacterium profundum]
MTNQQRIAVTGATGLLGRLLRMVWAAAPPAGLVPLWIGRSGGSGPDEICADLMADLPDLPKGCILLHLASVAPGRPPSDHAALARAAVAMADRAEARHLFVASTAAVYGIGRAPHAESGATQPVSDYGRAKLEAEAVVAGRTATTILRIGNVAGADAILGNRAARVVLDPVPGQPEGPLRSYIGPRSLARVMADLAVLAQSGAALPAILNIAQAPPVGMASLLRATGRDFEWGPWNPGVIPRVELVTTRLSALLPDLAPATADGLVAERLSLPDWQP